VTFQGNIVRKSSVTESTLVRFFHQCASTSDFSSSLFRIVIVLTKAQYSNHPYLKEFVPWPPVALDVLVVHSITAEKR